uniref:Endonuclease/exonuclease/phosphatase domain-containing protein n=1 Tax=Micrurus corallinus TaxID=54390 RepID=A0A2D4GB65_MICCO
MAEEQNLTDIWRAHNPKENRFTFYSIPHKSWSRIDMAWTSKTLVNDIESVEIAPNVWADHNPMVITWKGQQKQRGRWTLDPQILREKEYLERVKKEIDFFF